MPARGLAARGSLQGTLAGILHERMTSTRLADALQAAEEEASPGSEAAAQVREARREVDLASKLPADLTRALAEATTRGHQSWVAARAASDASLFEADLTEILQLCREEAACLAGPGAEPYDALLDKFEPGSTQAELAPLFDSLSSELSPLLRRVQESGRELDESPARGEFPPAAQEAFGRRVAEQIGFDFQAGRLDLAAHPFCSGFDAGDVRITWRFEQDDFRPALFGILHEAGHGLYEQGLRADWQRTPLGAASSLGLHESQSRLWENQVGRSRAFWEWALPVFREHFPRAPRFELDQLYPALHTTKPSLIRVEADQGTYDLHVALRFEIERGLFSGELEVRDLEGAWNERYEAWLGLRPPNVAQGVLQDIHWSMGGFGYFPTYTLGNLMNAQLFVAAKQAIGDLDSQMAAGNFTPLLDWLRENVHRHGRQYSAKQILERASGKPLGSEAFLAERRSSARELYGV